MLSHLPFNHPKIHIKLNKLQLNPVTAKYTYLVTDSKKLTLDRFNIY